jgi:leucyl aminopeptidase
MRISFSDDSLSARAADLLVVGVPAGQVEAALAGFGDFADALRALAKDEDFTGKPGSTVATSTLGRIAASRVLLVGTGAGTVADVRAAAGIGGTQARGKGARTVAFAFPGTDTGAAGIRAAIEAFAEGNYRFDKYKAEASRKAAAEQLVFCAAQPEASVVARATALVEGQNLARDLVNEPAAEIYPESLANVARSLASDRVTVTVLDENQIREKGMGGITGVGQGSARPPRFVHMSYTPAGTARGHIAFIGKGVTFDSGGLSLKPSDGMMTMRCDMAGAAAVIGAMKAIAAIQPAVKVDAIFGAVENMPSGTSYKLGDILKMYNGKRVEIHNTDAEGRLVLADCLSYASELKPDAVVDLATLTGAAVVALGDWYSALYTKSDELAQSLTNFANESGEGVWRMPLPDLYKDKLKAEWGDLKNVGGRAGGSITAALFLSEFVTVEKWAHIDIAGPAFLEAPLMHYSPGGTGTMVRTLARWAESYGA